jgi:O-antigen ligase
MSRALSKVLWFGVAVVLTFGASRALFAWNDRQIRVAVIAFLVALAVGLVFILIEIATEQALTRFVFNWLPFTRPDSFKKLKVEDGMIVRIGAFELNRNVAVLLLMLWPALLCLSRLSGKSRRRQLSVAALFVTAAIAIMFSAHESSKIGLIAGAIAFGTAWLWPAPARQGLLALWCLAFVAVVPLSTFLAKEHLHQVEWLPYSARARITLWAYTAEKIPDAPLLGIGLTSTRTLASDRTQSYRQEALAEGDRDNRVLVWKAGPHSHNEFLQAWYELGVVGVILLLAAGSGVIASIGRLSAAIQPFMLAQFAAFFAMAAFSWGMWQTWLMALTGLAALYAAMAARFALAKVTAPDKIASAAKPKLASGERVA